MSILRNLVSKNRLLQTNLIGLEKGINFSKDFIWDQSALKVKQILINRDLDELKSMFLVWKQKTAEKCDKVLASDCIMRFIWKWNISFAFKWYQWSVEMVKREESIYK